ncbi:hypothetical protein [Ornithinimicrobium panacihumi]|uniref:hypothetical protein n=1 Tax=Ornithinimicrobium panacihumi TaxID=2008449 RepID=UPI003F89F69E
MALRGTRSNARTLAALACAGALSLSACDSLAGGDSTGATSGSAGQGADRGDAQGNEEPADQATPEAVSATTSAPEDEALVLSGGRDERAVGVTEALFASASVVVLAEEKQTLRGASAAASLGVPLVVDGPDAAAELERLGAEVALVVGEVADPAIDVVVPQTDAELASLLGAAPPQAVAEDEAVEAFTSAEFGAPTLIVPEGLPLTAPTLTGDRDALPATAPAQALDTVAVLSTGEAKDLAALGSARAAGARVLVGPHTDPRASAESVEALAEARPATVIGLGKGFGKAEDLAWKVRTASTGTQLPGGGQLVLPGKTYVALYGTPGSGALGVLGEQGPEETIARAEEHAGWYEPLTDQTVVPTLEIIATVASSQAGADNDYSSEIAVEQLEPLVDLAEEEGLYVVLDLQPGRTDFLTQAKLYEDLLERPHVGLALDPEWRLQPHQVHLTQIGQVGIEEVNEVVDWLADLTRDNDLPQKVLVLHQFHLGMIPEADAVDQSREELALLIHADGQGAQPDKQATWRSLHQHAPSMKHWGWKNFYDEDTPMLSPEETMSQVDPLPDFISYQ